MQFAISIPPAGVLPFIAGAAVAASEPSAAAERASLLLVRGAAGTDEFGRMFDAWETQWRAAAEKGDVAVRTVGSDPDPDVRPLDTLRQAIREESDGSGRPLWIVLIGHGTFDGRDAKFNLTGPDFTARQLAEWLESVSRPLVVINCASSSAPFLDRLSMPGRVVVTATKSGHEVNFARFGGHLAQAIGDATADLDKDGQVSLLEAFLTASRRTSAAYEGLGQLATENALLDDTGDGLGVSKDFFDGLLPVKQAEGAQALDGHRAHQWHFVPSEEERRFPDELRPRRNELELEIAHLRDRKLLVDEDDYYAQLEPLLVELAELYERADSTAAAPDESPPPASGDAES